MNKLLSLFIAFLFSVSMLAQGDHKGCHHYKSLGTQKKFSDLEKTMMQVSNARSDTFDIIHYGIHLDVTDYSGQTIKGFTDITFEPILGDQTSVNFDLFELQVDSVKDESGLLNWSYDDELLNVEFSEVPDVGEELNVTVYYQGNPHRDPSWGGFYFEADYIYNLGIGLTTIPPNFGKVWYPCFDSFVERATYSYYITSDDGAKAHCQGDLMEELVISGDTVMRHYDFNYNITTHQSAIAVSDYETYEYTYEGDYDDIPVTLKARPAQFASMDDIFIELDFAIEALEYWYGPYPFSRIGYIMTTDGALEIPENIAYPQSMVGSSIFNNGQLFTHELGHQWWGNIVTPRLHNHMWIKEGPAEYSGHLFLEWMSGQEAFIEEVKNNLQFVLEEAHIQDNGFQVLSPIIDEEIYGRHTYYKGAAVMHNMRAYLGDELFRQAMMGVQADDAYISVDADEFKEVLEDASGAELDDFFNDWILAPGYSTWAIDSVVTTEGDVMFNSHVYLRQKLREAPNYHSNVPIQISALNEDWEYEDFDFVADGEFADFEFQTSYDPTMVRFDVHHKLNGARLEYDFVVTSEEAFNQNLPFVDFRFKKNGLENDSSYVRVEHIWSGPDAENTHVAIDQISANHYWIVDGDWAESSDFEGRLNYNGSESTDLDFDLVGTTEEDLMLVYREDPSQPWIKYPDYTWSAGSLTSGTGSFRMTVLKKGEYTFANGDVTLDIEPLDLNLSEFNLYPNPATERITITTDQSSISENINLEIYDLQGKLVKTIVETAPDFNAGIQVDIQNMSIGTYILLIKDEFEILDSINFDVIR